MFWDTKYVLFVMLPGLLIGLWAQAKLHFAYSKYSQVRIENGMTGAEAARHILDQAGLNDMPVEEVPGHLIYHYDPTKLALFLSSDNYHGNSVAAVGVAAHEAGHALQHLHQDAMFNFRMALVPITQFANYAWMGILLVGMFLYHIPHFLTIVVAIFSVLTLFQLVTLPVEYDASARGQRATISPRSGAGKRAGGSQYRAACRRADLCGRAGECRVATGVLRYGGTRQPQLRLFLILPHATFSKRLTIKLACRRAVRA